MLVGILYSTLRFIAVATTVIACFATQASAERRVALVMGNSQYHAAPKIPNPANDARDMAAVLRGLGFEVIEAIDFGYNSAREALRNYARALVGADVGLYYFAGHGLEVAGENYLVPVDATLEQQTDLDFETIRLDSIIKLMQREARINLLFIDASRSNPLLQRLGGARSVMGRGLAPIAPGPGTFIAFATEPGNMALDGSGRNSPFTAALLRHIPTPGANVQQIMLSVRRDVANTTNGRQMPWSYDSLLSEFYFQRPAVTAPVAQTANLRRIALVIGNSNYSPLSTLTNAENDARDVAQSFKRIGFNEVVEKHNLGLQEMTNTLKNFGDLAHDADWAVIFFAGHGIEIGGLNYLMPIDAKIERDKHVKDETMPLERVLEKVEPARRLRLVMLDACRDNPFSKRMIRSAGVKRSTEGGLDKIEPDGDVLVIYAAKHGQVAYDGDGANSPFTEAFLRHIEEPNLDLMTLIGKVRQAVLKKTANGQGPYFYGTPPAEHHYFRVAKN